MNITYCSNVHPIETFPEVMSFINNETCSIAAEITNGGSFPLGLWFPESTLEETMKAENLNYLTTVLRNNNFWVATLNGFPQNKFHGEAVKEKVYEPDWSSQDRLEYTKKLFELGRGLEINQLVISTLSGCFLPRQDNEKLKQIVQNFLQYVAYARNLYEETGFCCKLALEPEPFNTLQDADGAIKLWEMFRSQGKNLGLDNDTLNRHLGICFDTCHLSVRFKNPWSEYRKLEENSIPVFKVQVSVAPKWESDFNTPVEDFFNFAEPVYLHQSFAKDQSGEIHSFVDLDEAKASAVDAKEWRTHFHVPIHYGDHPQTTGDELIEFLGKLRESQSAKPIMEVETYSFSQIKDPAFSEKSDLCESIVAELCWLERHLLG